MSTVVWAIGRADDDVFGVASEGAARFRADFFLDPPQVRQDRLEGVITAAEFHGLFSALDNLLAHPVHDAEPLTAKDQSADILAVLQPQSAMRQTARMLVWQMREVATKADGAATAQAFARVMALGRSASHRPLLISRLCAIGIQEAGVKGLRTIIEGGQLPKGAASAIASELDRKGFADLSEMLLSEQKHDVDATVLLGVGDKGPFMAISGFLTPVADAKTRAEVESAVGAAQSRLAAMPPATSEAETAALSSLASKLQAIRVELEFLQHTEELRLMLAIERYREARGTLPVKVTDLVPEFMSEISSYADGTAVEYRQEGTSPSGYRVGRGS